MGVAVICAFVLPDWPHTTRWLTPEEQLLAAQRIAADHVGIEHKHLSHVTALKVAFSNWQLYIFMVGLICF